MISPAGSFRIFLASEPIDLRKGMDGLVAHVANHFELDPFDGAIYVFRSRRADRLKLLVWDGTGLVLTMKRLNGGRFIWPKLQAGPVTLTKVQFDALFEGIDWRAVTTTSRAKSVTSVRSTASTVTAPIGQAHAFDRPAGYLTPRRVGRNGAFTISFCKRALLIRCKP